MEPIIHFHRVHFSFHSFVVFKNPDRSFYRYAVMGNRPDSPLAIFDPNTGREKDMVDPYTHVAFKIQHNTQYVFMVRELLPRIRYYVGHYLHELPDLSTFPEPEFDAWVNVVREKILGDLYHFPFLEKFVPERRAEEFSKLGNEVNTLIEETIRDYFPAYHDVLGINNEVKATNDPARLLLMAIDSNLNPVVRHESKRKLLLMEIMGFRLEMMGRLKSDAHGACPRGASNTVGQEDSLSSMMKFLNARMNVVPEGKKTGHVETMYLVSGHDLKNGKKTMEASFQPTLPSQIKASRAVTPLRVRAMNIRSDKGDSRTVRCLQDLRTKGVFESVLKTLRKGTDPGQQDADYNGIRMVFETAKDCDDFVTTFFGELKDYMVLRIQERLRGYPSDPYLLQRLENINTTFNIVNEDNTLDGTQVFIGGSAGSSSDLKTRKIVFSLIDLDGKKHTYEFQMFLPDGYADYLYRDGVAWETYKQNRFFEGGLDELLFPSVVYPEVDHKQAHLSAIQNSKRSVWEKGQVVMRRNGKTRKGGRKSAVSG